MHNVRPVVPRHARLLLPPPRLAARDQRQPVCAGRLGRYHGLERGRSSAGLRGISHQLQADSGATDTSRRPQGPGHIVAGSLPDSQGSRPSPRAPGPRPSSKSIFFPCGFRGSARPRVLSPAITSRLSTAQKPRPMSTPCRSIAGPRTCSSAASDQASVGLPNKGQVFRKIGRRKLVPYYDRAEIEDGAIAGRGLEICWLKNQTDLLFTQIQGSARVSLEDGSTLRINYDAHNGYPYTPVGRILIERNIIPKEQMSMQKIREWMEQNPDGANELRRQNRSYVFFREVNLSDKDEAVGAQGVPLTPGPLDRGRQGAACLRHAVLHRGRAADRIRAIEDAVPPADDRAGYGIGDRRTRARRSLFRRRRRGRQGVRPLPAQCALRHPGSEEPRSVGAGPQDAGTGRAAVGENRKAVSASRSAEGSVQGATSRPNRRLTLRPRCRRRTAAKAAAPSCPGDDRRRLRSRSRYRCRKRGRISPPAVTRDASTSLANYRRVDETPAPTIPELPAPPRRRRPERGRARAVGQRREANQAAAQESRAAKAHVHRRKPKHRPRRSPRPPTHAAPRKATRTAKAASRRRWRRSAAASARNCRAAARRSMHGSICTA